MPLVFHIFWGQSGYPSPWAWRVIKIGRICQVSPAPCANPLGRPFQLLDNVTLFHFGKLVQSGALNHFINTIWKQKLRLLESLIEAMQDLLWLLLLGFAHKGKGGWNIMVKVLCYFGLFGRCNLGPNIWMSLGKLLFLRRGVPFTHEYYLMLPIVRQYWIMKCIISYSYTSDISDIIKPKILNSPTFWQSRTLFWKWNPSHLW